MELLHSLVTSVNDIGGRGWCGPLVDAPRQVSRASSNARPEQRQGVGRCLSRCSRERDKKGCIAWQLQQRS